MKKTHTCFIWQHTRNLMIPSKAASVAFKISSMQIPFSGLKFFGKAGTEGKKIFLIFKKNGNGRG